MKHSKDSAVDALRETIVERAFKQLQVEDFDPSSQYFDTSGLLPIL